MFILREYFQRAPCESGALTLVYLRVLTFRFADSREDVTGRRDYSRDERSLKLTAARRVDKDQSTELDYSLRDILHLREQTALQDGQIHEWRFRDQRPAGLGAGPSSTPPRPTPIRAPWPATPSACT